MQRSLSRVCVCVHSCLSLALSVFLHLLLDLPSTSQVSKPRICKEFYICCLLVIDNAENRLDIVFKSHVKAFLGFLLMDLRH